MNLGKMNKVRAKIEDVNGVAKELPIKVTLFQALPKGDKNGNGYPEDD